MAHIYAMSDIHGELDCFKQALQVVDLDDSQNQLILLGDYINRGEKSCETVYYVKQLQERYPSQVIVLRGNHEDMLLEQLESNYFVQDLDVAELKKFLTEQEWLALFTAYNQQPEQLLKALIQTIKANHHSLLNWLDKLPYFYETDKQIFVHAGIDEEADEFWKWGSENNYFVSKFPHVLGPFYKDIIAGHISTSTITGDEHFHRIFWDKQSHFYIDGYTNKSRIVPVLKYDTMTEQYYSYERIQTAEDKIEWRQYKIK